MFSRESFTLILPFNLMTLDNSYFGTKLPSFMSVFKVENESSVELFIFSEFQRSKIFIVESITLLMETWTQT